MGIQTSQGIIASVSSGHLSFDAEVVDFNTRYGEISVSSFECDLIGKIKTTKKQMLRLSVSIGNRNYIACISKFNKNKKFNCIDITLSIINPQP